VLLSGFPHWFVIVLLAGYGFVAVVGVLGLGVYSVDLLLRRCVSLRRSWRVLRDDPADVPAQVEPPAGLASADSLRYVAEVVEVLRAADVAVRSPGADPAAEPAPAAADRSVQAADPERTRLAPSGDRQPSRGTTGRD
jgi:hypothetical protein